ncbi:complex I subunit 1 family protein [Vitiosangium sp. GDMCC 1.1324]|uniref:complex I subunit 1/NuoH family protein n=1 Tax=Vitiosangium sp. (strain GDMCC 1.1324) TaxID=2138576 RepID=UPI000D354E28|nr:complex I subunit 1 family protein [Vitiosangium sp. GDMCC 1.1324]PTL78003.1 NADH-quinone oxidoreductase subunit H [Vitiosangium sp. GDMCC 1.1324]
MKRVLTILFWFGLMFAVMAVHMCLAYLLGGWVEEHLFPGSSRLTNMLILMLAFVMGTASLLTVAERKWSSLMQNRIGPNRARIDLPGLRDNALVGIPHFLADGAKMLFKEDFIPATANKLLYNLGPMLAFAPVFALFAVVPAGPSATVFGHSIDMVVATPDFGLLYVFAIASLAVYGTSLAGWSSNNKFALLGGVRASSQMISYEVALGLSLVGLMMAFSTVQLPAFVGHVANELGMGVEASGQARYLWSIQIGSFDLGIPAWGFLLQPLGFFLFFAAAFAETKRAPFDTPEGESEIIGYFVEYSGMKFGLFMISEFVEIVVLSGLIVVLFFGGYHLPFGGEWFSNLAVMKEYSWLYGAILGTVFWAKVMFFVWLQLTIRWTFLRFRYDQIQSLGWKILLPLGLINVFVTGALVLWDPSLQALALFGIVQIGFLLTLTLSSKEKGAEGHGHGGAHGAHGHGHDDAHGHGAPAHAHAAHADTHSAGAHSGAAAASH